MFRKQLLIFTIIGLCLSQAIFAQKDRTQRTIMTPEVIEFSAFKKEFLAQYWAANPMSATYQGLADYCNKLDIPTKESALQKLSIYSDLMGRLAKYDYKKLSPSDQIDYQLMKNQVQKKMWYIQSFQPHIWKPSYYNVSSYFDKILNHPELDDKERLYVLEQLLQQLPTYYRAAVSNLKKVTIEHTELAISQLKGGLNIFEQKIPDYVAKSKEKGIQVNDQGHFDQQLEDAIASINRYIEWLQINQPSPEKARPFRIGQMYYERKFNLEISADMKAKELYQLAQQAKKETHVLMGQMAASIWPKYFKEPMPTDRKEMISQLIDTLSTKHSKREDFVEDIRKQLAELTAFVNEKQILRQDTTKPLKVRETPAYMRGVSVASISAPGPYDAEGETYYNVAPLDKYTEEEAESYLREYNHYMLQILNIHEAIPGHYTQLYYANQSPSIIKSLFGDGPMIEGWACYTERMMLEEGYGNQSPELWLLYYKWYLRIVCNTILDYSVHNLNMSKEEGIDLLMNEAFQEKTEAEGKWRRATLSQVQLCEYFAGFSEIYQLRKDYKALKGDAYTLKEFNETFLSFGSAPVSAIRKLMLGTDTK